MNYLDIVITQAILFKDDVLISLGAEGGGFVSNIRAKSEQWPQWSVIDPFVADRIRGFEMLGLLRSLGFAHKFDCAICERVHNHQRATDLGLDDFWIDPGQTGIRLIERSYSLLATDFGQFVLVFCFRFDGGTPEGRAEMLVRVCAHRAIRANTGQQGFSRLAIRYAEEEVDRVIGLLKFEEKSTSAHVVASPTSHDSVGWITNPEDLTAYPWILAGALSPSITEIFAAEDRPVDAIYSTPLRGNPCSIIGNNYGIYLEVDEERPMRLEIMPLLVQVQATYYTTRQIQRIMVNEMRLACSLPENGELKYDESKFDRFSLYFNRYVLGYNHFNGAQLPKLLWFLDKNPWYKALEKSHDHLAQAVAQHHNYLRSRSADRAHRDAGRQEAILFAIAILQIFSIMDVFSDYSELNPAIKSGNEIGVELEPEKWLFHLSPWLPRLLVFLVIGILLWYTYPSIRKWYSKVRAGRRKAHPSAMANIPISPSVDPNRFLVRQSLANETGLFAARQFKEGEVLLIVPGGDPVAIEDIADNVDYLYEVEWNATPGKLHLRRGLGTPYRLINHSRQPNATVSYDSQANNFRIISLRTIKRGEEILIDYRMEPLPKAYVVQRGGYL